MNSLIEPIAWALIHFLWQGLAAGMVAALGLRWLRSSTPDARYLWSCFGLFLMAACPLATFLMTTSGNAAPPIPVESLWLPENTALPAIAGSVGRTAMDWRPALVAAWCCGVAFFLLRLFAGWTLTYRWRRAVLSPVPGAWLRAAEHLRLRLGISRRVRLAVTSRIDTPAVVGFIRPYILMPVSLLRVAPEQIELLLAHELSHIRRHDALVNFFQRIVEAALFYHPAVWWLSARIRQEREHCCDDAAVAICGNPALYARALVELEERRASVPALAVAASDGDLLSRIRRVLGARDETSDPWTPIALTAVTLGLLALGNLPSTNVVQYTQRHVVDDFEALLATARAELDPRPALRTTRRELRPVRWNSVIRNAGLRVAPVSSGPKRNGKPMRFGLMPVVAAVPPADLLDPQEAPPAPPAPPAAPAPPAPPAVAAPPAPPPPPVAPRTVWKSEHNWSINLNDDAVHFVHEGKHYVSRDPDVIAQARSAFQFVREIGSKQRGLAQQQRELARSRAEAARKLHRENDEWRREMSKLQRELDSAVSRRQIKDIQEAAKDIEEKARELEKLSKDSESRLAGKMKILENDMNKFGFKMKEMGEEMRKADSEAKRKLRELLGEAVKSGKAQPESF